MKKIAIGSLVGAIILFVWSFLAWTVLPLNLRTYMYTPAQDAILKVLADNQVQTGVYAMPMADNRDAAAFDSKFHEESEQVMKANEGKPGASVYYLKEGFNMGIGTIIRGFLINLLTMLAACILLAPAFVSMSSFFGRWWLTLVVGLLVSACGPLIQYNWMGIPWEFTEKMILNTFLAWGIPGLWLAYYFKKE